MRIAALILIAGAIVGGTSVAVADGPDRKEAKKLVAEYLASTDDERRAAIVKRLREANPKHINLALKNGLKKEETREAAMQLIESIPVAGLHSALYKYIDSPLQENVLRALVAVDDEKSHKLAFERWKKSEEGSPQFAAVNEALVNATLHPAMVRRFRSYLGKEGERGEATAQILKTQLLLDDEAMTRLPRDWDLVFGRFVLENQPFKLRGVDLLERRESWKSSFGEEEDPREAELCTWKRGRLSIAPGGVIRLAELGKEELELMIKVLVRETDACSFGVMRQGNAFVGVNLVGQTWRGLMENQDPIDRPVTDDQWTTVHIVVTEQKATVNLDGSPISITTQGGICEEIYFRGGTKGELFVGAVQLLSR